MELKLANQVEKGIAFFADRRSEPCVLAHVPMRDEHIFKADKLPSTHYKSLDELEQRGLIKYSTYRDYTNVVWTYAGKKLYLEMKGFDHQDFINKYSQGSYRICCPQAIPTFCVCILRTMCPDHGNICRGSHD